MRLVPLVVATILCTGLVECGNLQGRTQREASQEANTKKLDGVVQRLEAIESWISNLDRQRVNLWRPDRRGILLDGNGKAIGVWGVDSIIERPAPTWILD